MRLRLCLTPVLLIECNMTTPESMPSGAPAAAAEVAPAAPAAPAAQEAPAAPVAPAPAPADSNACKVSWNLLVTGR